MSSRSLLATASAFLGALVLSTAPALAQSASPVLIESTPDLIEQGRMMTERVVVEAPLPQSRVAPNVLRSLYVSTAIMQALDIHSTLQVLNGGGVEANPLMRDVVRNRTAFIATKAGVTAGALVAAHRVGKRNRVAAIVTLAAINAGYAYVAARNYRVAREMR